VSADTNFAVATPATKLNQRALSLGVAQGVDYAMQLLLPLVLVRCLDAAAFGQYRLLWLVVATVLPFANMAMPASLFYFLPRSDGPTRRLYVNQTLAFLAVAGLVASIAVGPWSPWMPENARGLTAYGAFVPAFVLLSVVASLLDQLPTADDRSVWQAKATIGLATLRATALSAAAILTRDLGGVLAVLLAFVIFKLAVLIVYVARHHGLGGPLLRWPALCDQVRYAAPFGVGAAIYMLRSQADQWVAATLFPLGMFASFSIAAVLEPLLNVFRQAAALAFLPSMSRLQASGDLRGALALNSRANVMIATLFYPLLVFAFVFAEDLVTLVYTAAYIDAATVMRVYVFGAAAFVIELGTVTLVLRQGSFILALNLVTFGCSAVVSWYAAQRFGLAGAAVGSVTMAYLDRVVTLWRISCLAGMAIRRLQDWRTLGLQLLLAALAGTLAYAITRAYFTQSEPLVRVIAGGAILAVAYGVVRVCCRETAGKALRAHQQGD